MALTLKNNDYPTIDLTKIGIDSNKRGLHYNTELTIDNCKVGMFNAAARVLGKKIVLKNCEIGQLICHGTHFIGGFEILNCLITEYATFDCGGHNAVTTKFIVNECTFEKHLDFFDTYLGGTIRITNNIFKKGTSASIYLQEPFGLKAPFSLFIDNNQGNLEVYAENDPNKK